MASNNDNKGFENQKSLNTEMNEIMELKKQMLQQQQDLNKKLENITILSKQKESQNDKRTSS